jgi:hypothetical protein
MIGENEQSLREREVLQRAKWDMLRSDIYIRDKGVCWVCNERVELKDYDLGHLIDRCNGGQDDYDNLAVMHKHCNITKPRHTSLEEAMKWKLTHPFLNGHTPKVTPKEQLSFISTSINTTSLPMQSPVVQQPLPNPMAYINHQVRRTQKLFLSKEDEPAVKELVLEHFRSRPHLLVGNLNHERSQTIRELSESFKTPIQYIRKWILDAGLVKHREMKTDGSQYKYVYDHLDELLNTFDKDGSKVNLLDRPYAMGITNYQIDIMFYLAGMPDKVSRKNFPKIQKRVAQLNIPIRRIS